MVVNQPTCLSNHSTWMLIIAVIPITIRTIIIIILTQRYRPNHIKGKIKLTIALRIKIVMNRANMVVFIISILIKHPVELSLRISTTHPKICKFYKYYKPLLFTDIILSVFCTISSCLNKSSRSSIQSHSFCPNLRQHHAYILIQAIHVLYFFFGSIS